MSYHKRNKLIHGYKCRKHPLYDTWANMKRRCLDSDCKVYKNYGGRGVTVSDAWMDFETFALDMGLRPNMFMTLERDDNDKGYSKSNCRWAGRITQSNNRRKENLGKGVRDENGRFTKTN